MKKLSIIILASSFFATTVFATAFANNSTNGIALKKIIEKTDNYSIEIRYPELKNTETFNSEIKETMQNLVKNFKEDSQDSSEDIDKDYKDFVETRYKVIYRNENFISFLFTVSIYTGGVHPMHYTFGRNYDLKNQKILTLNDIFLPTTNYLEKLSSKSRAILKRNKGLDAEWIDSGTEAKEETFSSLNVSKNWITITFDQYVVDSYAGGPHIIKIRIKPLKKIFNPEVLKLIQS